MTLQRYYYCEHCVRKFNKVYYLFFNLQRGLVVSLIPTTNVLCTGREEPSGRGPSTGPGPTEGHYSSVDSSFVPVSHRVCDSVSHVRTEPTVRPVATEETGPIGYVSP